MKTGDWAYCTHHGENCRIVAIESLWSKTYFRVWLTNSDTVVRVSEDQVISLHEAEWVGQSDLSNNERV